MFVEVSTMVMTVCSINPRIKVVINDYFSGLKHNHQSELTNKRRYHVN